MRLLHARDFTFKVFHKNPEPYAILAHRWTESETTMTDIETGRVHSSTASNKVSSFALYVKSQVSDLEWIWMDSCCIKQETAELSEGVNCMFDWYRNANVCIAYLSDVEHPSDRVASRKSIWFKRGWTLQELLASTVVVFLTTNWQVIGHKGDAAHLEAKTDVGPNIESFLAEVTGIPQTVLQDFSVSHELTIEDRMRWMRGRETLREEDMYYALFGVFGVTPGANYGENRHGAEIRLLEAIERKERLKAGRALGAQEKRSADVVNWLSPADPSTNHASARERHESGTCAWLLEHEQYKSWKAGTTRHLWLHGKPGCGKSVLCSTVLQDLRAYYPERANIGLAYFYFTFSDDSKQSYRDLMVSLVSQFAGGKPARSLLHQMCEKSEQTKPSMLELEKILVLTVATFDEAFIVLDALDESPELHGKRMELLKRLGSLVSQTLKLKLFATSRYIPDICGLLEDLPCGQISIRTSDIRDDIQKYVVTQLSTEPRLRRFQPAIKSMIEENISHNADGIFRWAFLLLNELTRLKRSNRKTIEVALKRFPKGLDDVYARLLQDLEEDDQKDAVTLLQWITYSREPLSLGQLVDTLIIKPESGTVDFDDRCQPDDILRLLTSLVITVTDKDVDGNDSAGVSVNRATKIRLAHFTVQEYLESTRITEIIARPFHLESRTGHYLLTQSCLMYILHYSSEEKESSHNDLETFPLLRYAAEQWYHHSSANKRFDVGLEVKLLDGHATMRRWLAVHSPDQPCELPFRNGHNDSLGSNLYYASYMGLERVVGILLKGNADVNAEGGMYGNALQAASATGHVEIVALLLEKNADANAEGGYYGSVLQAATSRGYFEIVKLLLKKGANVNAKGGRYGGALQAASAAPAEFAAEVVKYLLEKNADGNAIGGWYGSAIQAASKQEYIEIVKLLLKKNANVNAEGGMYGSALQAASAEGHIEIVELLLGKGANVSVEGSYVGTAMEAASTEGTRR